MALRLTSSQEDIVFASEARILVLAAPGCGKTTTLASHLGNVIKCELTPVSKILCLSFSILSMSAISESLQRTMPNLTTPPISTFGSFCYSVIKRHLSKLHTKLEPRCAVLEENDEFLLEEVRAILRKHNISESRVPDFCDFLRRVQDNRSDEVDTECFSLEMVDELRESLFSQNCLLRGDFSLLAWTLLKMPDVFEAETVNVKRLYVDEYQDVNYYQAKIIELFANRNGCYCFITGNADECVYGFRGASDRYLKALIESKRFRVFDNLTENFRSRQGIVDFSQSLERQIDTLQGIATPRNRIKARFESDNKPSFLVFDSKEHECRYVADAIGRLVHENQVRFGDIAVLSFHGSSGFELGQIKSNLIALGYPCTTHGDKENEAETQVMSSVFVCLEAFLDNQLGNFLNRVTTLMKVSYNQKGFKNIATRLTGKECLTAEEAIPILHERVSEIPPKAVHSLSTVYHAYTFFQNERSKVTAPKGASLSELLMDLEIFLIDRISKDQVLAKAFERAALNLKEMENQGEGRNPYEVLATLHDGVSTFRDEDAGVQLMTFTRSKGLQFHYVFLVGLEPDTFPGESPSRQLSKIDRLRLFYVAATRAKYDLCLTAVGDNPESFLSASSESVLAGLADSVRINGDFGKTLSLDATEDTNRQTPRVDHQIEVSERLRKECARGRMIIQYLQSDETDLEEKSLGQSLLALLEEKTKAKTDQLVANEKKTIDWYGERITSLLPKLDKYSQEVISSFLDLRAQQDNPDSAYFYRVSIKTVGTLVELFAVKTDQFRNDIESERILREYCFRDSCHQLLIPILRVLNQSSSDSLSGLLHKTNNPYAVFWEKCSKFGIDLEPASSEKLIGNMKTISALMDTYYHFKNAPTQDVGQRKLIEKNQALVNGFLSENANRQRRILLSCVRFFEKFFRASEATALFNEAAHIIYSED